MNEEEFRTAVTNILAEGGWSSIRFLVDSIDIDTLRSIYYHLDENEELINLQKKNEEVIKNINFLIGKE